MNPRPQIYQCSTVGCTNILTSTSWNPRTKCDDCKKQARKLSFDRWYRRNVSHKDVNKVPQVVRI